MRLPASASASASVSKVVPASRSGRGSRSMCRQAGSSVFLPGQPGESVVAGQSHVAPDASPMIACGLTPPTRTAASRTYSAILAASSSAVLLSWFGLSALLPSTRTSSRPIRAEPRDLLDLLDRRVVVEVKHDPAAAGRCEVHVQRCLAGHVLDSNAVVRGHAGDAVLVPVHDNIALLIGGDEGAEHLALVRLVLRTIFMVTTSLVVWSIHTPPRCTRCWVVKS